MNTLRLSFLCLFAGLFLAETSLATDGSVTILSPAEGAILDAMGEHRISYAVEPGPRGDHTHLYVDGKEVAVLRRLKGDYALPILASGNREVCIKVVNKGHTPIGIEQCIKVMVE